MAQIEEKPLDIQHFFETRQQIAGEFGDIHSQRRITDIRQTIAEQKAEEARLKRIEAVSEKEVADEKKPTKKTTKKSTK